jgi:hypothetical protein
MRHLEMDGVVAELYELRRFGLQVDRHVMPMLEVGGFLRLGEDSAKSTDQGKEERENGRAQEGAGAGAEGRPEAGPRQGRRAPSAPAADSASPSVDGWLASKLGLEELREYHPNLRWHRNSSNSILLEVPIGLFSSLPFRATLVLELPTSGRAWLREVGPELPRSGWARLCRLRSVPYIRIWSYWSNGLLVSAAHQYPDLSACYSMHGEWVFGTNSIEDVVAFGTCWTAKKLHEDLLGRWPGRQHLGAIVRRTCSRETDLCGCGSEKQWKDCHRDEDLARNYFELEREQRAADLDYKRALSELGLPSGPPALAW